MLNNFSVKAPNKGYTIKTLKLKLYFILLEYFNEMIIIGDELRGIQKLKKFLSNLRLKITTPSATFLFSRFPSSTVGISIITRAHSSVHTTYKSHDFLINCDLCVLCVR